MQERQLHYIHPAEPSGSISGFSLIIKAIRNQWPVFLLSLMLWFMLAAVYLRYATRHYVAHSSILIRDNARGSDFGETAVLEELGASPMQSSVDNEIEVLKSRTLMESVVDDLHLQVQYWVSGNLRTAELYRKTPYLLKVLSEDGKQTWPARYRITELPDNRYKLENDSTRLTAQFGEIIKLPGTRATLTKTVFKPLETCRYHITIGNKDDIIQYLLKQLKVTASNKAATLVSLSLSEILPEKAETVLARLLTNYQQVNASDQNQRATKTIAFLNRNLKEVSSRLQKDEAHIEQFRRKHGLIDLNEHGRMILRDENTTANEVSKYNAQLKVLYELEKKLHGTTELTVPASLTMQEPAFTTLIGRYNEILTKKVSYLSSARAAHPRVHELEQQLSSLRSDLENSIQAHLGEISIYLAELRKFRSTTTRQAHELPNWERNYQALLRQQQIDQELYTLLLKKHLETSVSRSSNISNARVVDPPLASPIPIDPDPRVTLLMAGVIGLTLPMLLLHLRALLNTSVMSKADVFTKTHLPVIGELMHASRKERQLSPSFHSAIAEQFRTLRTNIHFLPASLSKQVILITSGTSHEGKSWIALNLAETISQSGKKVLLIDLDLRKQGISHTLKLQHPGIADLLVSPGDPAPVIVQPTSYSFHILTSGKSLPDPLSAMMSDNFGNLMTGLRSVYDHIIIDSPPAGLMADALLAARHADLALYVIRLGFTPKDDLDNLSGLNARSQLPAPHIILNDLRLQSADAYQYYHYRATRLSILGRLVNNLKHQRL